MIGFGLAVIAFFTWYSNTIPQIESHPPKKISLDAPLSADEMIGAGERVFNGKGTCNICHAIGRPGNRGPDLAGIGQQAGSRQPGVGGNTYLLESLLKPSDFLVEGYGPLMPPMGAILTPGEVMVTVAFLQSLGGEVDITPGEVRAAVRTAMPTPAAASAAAAAPAAQGARATPAGGGDPGKGRAAFLQYCAPCHGPDPGKDGPLGPMIRGATAELLAARVMRATYPPGYAPKRATKLMPPMPQLEGEVPDLAAYLKGKE